MSGGGAPPVQTPAWQESPAVQALPSLQGVPFGAFGLEQRPVPGLQVPATWHWSLAVQTTGFEPVQAPPWQVSVCVQALPSVQVVPSGAAGFEHTPFAGLQTPATWHASLAVQTTGFEPVQVPPWQVSVSVQALPSSQPFEFGVKTHWPVAGLNVSSVQGLWSSHGVACCPHGRQDGSTGCCS